MFEVICEVSGRVNVKKINVTRGPSGNLCREVQHATVLELGKTELTSFVEWDEKVRRLFR